MAVKITLENNLNYKEERWLLNNIGPRQFYLHNMIGGKGWVAKRIKNSYMWELTIEDEHLADIFILKFK